MHKTSETLPKRTKSAMNSVMKGNTGEFYALAELSRRGWTAAQTARNTRVFDILARKDAHQVGIRVKTKTSDARVFQWNAKENGEIFLDIGVNKCARDSGFDRKNFIRKLVRGIPVKRNSYNEFVRWLQRHKPESQN